MDKQSTALTALPENLGSTSSIHMALTTISDNHSVLDALFWPPQALFMHVVHIHTCMWYIYIHAGKILIGYKIKIKI